MTLMTKAGVEPLRIDPAAIEEAVLAIGPHDEATSLVELLAR